MFLKFSLMCLVSTLLIAQGKAFHNFGAAIVYDLSPNIAYDRVLGIYNFNYL